MEASASTLRGRASHRSALSVSLPSERYSSKLCHESLHGVTQQSLISFSTPQVYSHEQAYRHTFRSGGLRVYYSYNWYDGRILQPLLLGLKYDLLVPGTVKVHGAPIQILDLRMWFFRQTTPQASLTKYPI